MSIEERAIKAAWTFAANEPTAGELEVPKLTDAFTTFARAELSRAGVAEMREALARAEKRLKSLRYEVHNDSLAGNEYQAAMIDGDLDAIRTALNSADGVKP